MPTATVTSKGQITIPQEVRQRLSLESGDRVEFSFEADGSVKLRQVAGSVHDLFGMLRRRGRRRVSIERIDQSLSDTLAADDARIRRGAR